MKGTYRIHTLWSMYEISFQGFLFQHSELTELQGLNKKLIKIPRHCIELNALHFSHKVSTGHCYEPSERVQPPTHCSCKVHLNIISFQHWLWCDVSLHTLSLFHTSLSSNPAHNAWFNRSSNIREILPLWVTSACSLLPITWYKTCLLSANVGCNSLL
jgi:hypothetical protein